MEDDNKKDDPNEPSTSKKPSQSNNSVEENDSRGDQATNRDMSDSDSFSGLSDVEMASPRPMLPKGPILKTDAKNQAKKKKTKRLAGKIKKRERPPVKRPRKPLKRKPKTREERKERDISVSTIFTRLSSSGYQTPGCDRCGHRCCLRRYEYELRKKYNRNNKQKLRKCNRIVKRYKYSKKEYPMRISEANQAGSRSNMLSPLFISTNSSPAENFQQPAKSYCEINPEMIHEAVRQLTMWKQDVPTNSILEYIIKKFPVNNEKSELAIELFEKLTIAAIVGIVSRSSADTWSLSHEFQKRRLTRNHVSMFWKVYADTLRPIAKKDNNDEQDKYDNKTATNVTSLIVHDEDIL